MLYQMVSQVSNSLQEERDNIISVIFSFNYLRIQSLNQTKPNISHTSKKMSSLSFLTFLVNLFLLQFIASSYAAKLRVDYYRKTCPNVESIVHNAVEMKLQQTFVTAPSTLRLFFHDCFVQVSVICLVLTCLCLCRVRYLMYLCMCG
jgi:hypothetical protein